MKKINPELAGALGLTPADGAETELRSELNSKIVEIVARKKLTYRESARLAKASRTRVGDTEPEYKERVDRFAVEATLCTWVYGEAQNQEGGVRLAAAERGVW